MPSIIICFYKLRDASNSGSIGFGGDIENFLLPNLTYPILLLALLKFCDKLLGLTFILVVLLLLPPP